MELFTTEAIEVPGFNELIEAGNFACAIQFLKAQRSKKRRFDLLLRAGFSVMCYSTKREKEVFWSHIFRQVKKACDEKVLPRNRQEDEPLF